MNRIRLLIAASLLLMVVPAYGLPLFARKYGLPCSACHQAWPMLNHFGQTFRDNGYQLGNDRDAPVYQQPAYFPLTFRTTPQWHYESTNRVVQDVIAGDPSSGLTEGKVSTSGFDLSGLDIWAAGTLAKNISFAIQPAVDINGRIHLQTSYVRFDNLLGSSWLNVKFGKFELDSLISERRSLTLNNTGGFYYNFHFLPVGDANSFGGLGGNQLGVELMGHSKNSYRRYSVALLSSDNGNVGLPVSNTYDVYADFTQGFEIPHLGLQQVGVFGYLGQAPTYFKTANGNPIAGTGSGSRSFYRAGAYGLWYLGKFTLTTFYEHGSDNVFLGNAVPSNQPFRLPTDAVGPSWNGGYGEVDYIFNKQLILIGRYELVRMAQQANPNISPSDKGNLNAWTVGYRWYPIMTNRAGLAWVQEFSRVRTLGVSGLSNQDVATNTYLMGFDFDF